MPLTLNSFTPTTKIQSAQVNTNFTAIQTLLNNLRSTYYFYLADLQITGTNVTVEITVKTENTLYLVETILTAKTPPTGTDLIIDINKNGSSLYTTRPQIDDGGSSGGGSAVFTGSNPTLVDGDVLTIDVDQVGSTEPGRDISIALVTKL